MVNWKTKKGNAIKTALLSMLLALLCLLAAAFGMAFQNKRAHAAGETETVITGMQLRADTGAELYYLVLITDGYGGLGSNQTGPSTGEYPELLSAIKLYKTKGDAGVSAADICNTGAALEYNKWGQPGLFIPIAKDKYENEGYNGTDVYKVTVNGGAVLPNSLKVDKTSEYFNLGYGNSDAKYGSYNWAKLATVDTTQVTLFGDPDLNDPQAMFLWFSLSTHDYSAATPETKFINSSQASVLNWGEKIKLTIGGQQKTLGEYSISEIDANQYTREGAPLALIVNGLSDYTQIESVTIEAGCQFPSHATRDANLAALDNTTKTINVYKTTEDVTFTNNGSSIFDLPNNAIDAAVTFFGDPDAASSDKSMLWFTLSQNDYAEYNQGVNATQIGALNWGDKIKITIGGTDKYLKEYGIASAELYKFVRDGKPVALTVNGITDYTAIDKITIEAGCEFPSAATAGKAYGGGYTVYKTTETVTFVNDGYGSFYNKEKLDSLPEQNTSLTGVQLRGDEAGYYFVMQTAVYEAMGDASSIVPNSRDFEALLSKITFYTSYDGNGISASELCSLSGWRLNLWGSFGLMIPIKTEYYNTYNGMTVAKVAVDEGALMPAENAKLKTTAKAVYVNNSYGVEANKNGAFSWTYYDHDPADDQLEALDTAITGVQLRGDADANDGAGIYFLVLQTVPYSTIEMPMAVPNSLAYGALLNKITFYTSSDGAGVSAADICSPSGWEIYKWGEHGLFIPIPSATYETFNGTTVAQIAIAAGAVLPYDATCELKTTAEITYINSDYGNSESRNGAYYWTKLIDDADEEIIPMDITGVQLRADVEGGLYYLVVTADYYGGLGEKAVYLPGRFDELLSKIRLYMSAEDTVGVSAAEICLTTDWLMDRWGSSGIMFPMTGDNYDLYNGTTVYKIAIEAGAIFPGDGCKLRMEKAHAYINVNYGKEDNKNSGFTWSAVPAELVNFGETKLTTMHNRADESYRWLFLFVTVEFEKQLDVTVLLEMLNTLDYIEFYPTQDLTATPITLRQIYTGETTIYKFGESTAMSFTIDKLYDTNKMYMVHIKPGCQIPYIVGDDFGYRVVTSGKSFVNAVYGLTGDIFGVYGDDGIPRTYENWNIWWNAVSQVSLKVVGLEGVSYPVRFITAGDVLELKDYFVDGYDVTLTLTDGTKCYGGYVVQDEDVELVLTYTVATDSTAQKGCKGEIGTYAILALVVSTIVLAGVLVLTKKEGGANK